MPGEIVPVREFYDYEAKYLDDGSQAAHPGGPGRRDRSCEVRRLAVEAFKAVDCAGMARVDFLLARDDRAPSTSTRSTRIPGFTTISMYSKLWAASGLDYPALLDRLIQLALERHGSKQSLRTSALAN